MLRLIALLMVSEFVRTGFVVAFLPLNGAHYGLSPAQTGAIVSAHYLMDALAKGPMGAFTQRLGLGGALSAAALLGLGLLLVLPLGWPTLLLMMIGAVWGLFYSALWPGVMAAAQQYAVPGYEARALSITSMSVAPAVVLGALGVGQLMQHVPTQVSFILLDGQIITVLLALSLWPVRLSAPPRQLGNSWRSQWRKVAGLLPAAFAQTLAPGLLVTLFYPLLQQLGLTLRGLILPTLFGASILVLTLLLAGRAADKLHPRFVLGPGLVLLAVIFWLAGFVNITAYLYPLAALLGLAYGCFMAGWNGLVGLTLPLRHRAVYWGIVMAVESMGYAIGPLLGGLLWATYGLRGVFWLGSLVFLLVEGYYLVVGRNWNKVKDAGEQEHLNVPGN